MRNMNILFEGFGSNAEASPPHYNWHPQAKAAPSRRLRFDTPRSTQAFPAFFFFDFHFDNSVCSHVVVLVRVSGILVQSMLA